MLASEKISLMANFSFSWWTPFQDCRNSVAVKHCLQRYGMHAVYLLLRTVRNYFPLWEA